MSDVPPPEIIIEEESLPFELVENILSRLPVKTLKRFRAVEKSWCRLIDSAKFQKRHLQHSLASNSNRNLISGLFGFYWLSVDSLDNAPHSIKLEFEYDTKDIHAISNSCNGLVVVKRDPEPPILLNPFSREFKVLPVCPLDFPADSSLSCKTTYGFGYDSKNDDYKVVKVMLFEKPSEWAYSEEWIYSLRADCWRRTAGTYYDRGNWPIHVNGALHALVQSGSGGIGGMKIRGFSVETEKDYEVAMPEAEGIDMKGFVYACLDVFDGHLAFVCVYPSRFDVLVMKEYGVKESWVPLLSTAVHKDGFIRPLVYMDGGDKILLNYSCRVLTLLNVRQRSAQHFNMPLPFAPGLCVETLVSPHGWPKKNGSADKLNKERDDFLSSGFKLVL